jgi:FtsH-binding integral membrane protein
MRNIGMILLCIWLIVSGLVVLLSLNIPGIATILAIVAIAAGVLLLFEGQRIKLSKNLGMLLLSIYLILTGLLELINFSFPASGTILALLAIAAGVLLWLRR